MNVHGGYYGLVVRGERIAGKQDGPSLDYLWATQPPPPPRIAKNVKKKSHWGPYMKNWWLFVPLFYICLLCDEVILSW